ncbi:YceD family protein [Roseivirga echinicomitans]
MKQVRKYEIQIFKLNAGRHDFEFQLDDKFFDLFDNEIVSKGKLTANVSLNKSETMIQTVFRIKGSVELECDRSLDLFDFPIDLERPFIYKLGNEHEELSEEVVVIPRDTQQLNVASIMFEFIGLEIPMKKLHPRFHDEDDDNEDEVIMIYSSEEEEEMKENQENEESIDPRWASLKKLKNKE